MADYNSKKSSREKALILVVAVIILIGAGAVALFGVGLASWAASECMPGDCDGTRQTTEAVVACIGLIPACAGVWAAGKGDRDLFLGFTIATGVAWFAWLLVVPAL